MKQPKMRKSILRDSKTGAAIYLPDTSESRAIRKLGSDAGKRLLKALQSNSPSV